MASAATRLARAAGFAPDVSGFASLVARTGALARSDEDVALPDLATAAQSQAIVRSGRDILPGMYGPEFLDGLQHVLDSFSYASILDALDRGGEGPWRDWHAAIQQRTLDERRTETHGFLEVIRDFFDGFLSLAQRIGVKPPDHETISPLVKWGAPTFGPYTWPAHWHELGVRVAVVSMPPAYSRNVALWAALGHETAGHDVLHADDGLLTELAEQVAAALRNSDLTGTVQHRGQAHPIREFLAEYWSQIIDETASDICGVLNLGPAAGIGLASLLVPFGNGALSRWTSSTDPHPIDLSRLWLASELVRGLRFLNEPHRGDWARALDSIADDFGEQGDLELRQWTGATWVPVTRFPRDEFRRSAGIVARTIGFGSMAALEGRSLADINTWTSIDDQLTFAAASDLLSNRPITLIRSAEASTYAAHVLSAGVTAMVNRNADIDAIHDGTVEALSRLYDENPVWGRFPALLPRDPVRHVMLSELRAEHRPNGSAARASARKTSQRGGKKAAPKRGRARAKRVRR